MTEKIFCEKCGAGMIDRSEGDSVLVECPKCGWGWATTSCDPSADDDTEYEIWLRPGNTQSTEVLQLITGVANINFLQAKAMLSSDAPVILYKAYSEAAPVQTKVQKIQDISRKLTDANLMFFIVPDFSYDLKSE